MPTLGALWTVYTVCIDLRLTVMDNMYMLLHNLYISLSCTLFVRIVNVLILQA